MKRDPRIQSGTETGTAGKQVSEYAMAFDLLSGINYSGTEQETIESILRVFEILFSPRVTVYAALENGVPQRIYSLLPLEEPDQQVKDRLTGFNKKFAWKDSEKGFILLVVYDEIPMGMIEMDDFTFPEHRERYLNLALSMVSVCGLAIENARRFQQIRDAGNKLKQEKEKLEAALSEVKKLSGLIPICGHCKKIRDDKGYWNQVEAYIQERSEARFSHGICQECAKKYYPDYHLYDS